MLSDLAELIERVDIGGSDLAEALFLRDRFDARVTMAVAAFDARGDWAADGAVNATQWLRANAGMRAGDAAALVRRTSSADSRSPRTRGSTAR